MGDLYEHPWMKGNMPSDEQVFNEMSQRVAEIDAANAAESEANLANLGNTDYGGSGDSYRSMAFQEAFANG